MVLSPSLSVAVVVNAMTVSARPVAAVRVTWGGTRSRRLSLDVGSLHAPRARANSARVVAYFTPRPSAGELSMDIRVTVNGWLVEVPGRSLEAARHHR